MMGSVGNIYGSNDPSRIYQTSLNWRDSIKEISDAVNALNNLINTPGYDRNQARLQADKISVLLNGLYQKMNSSPHNQQDFDDIYDLMAIWRNSVMVDSSGHEFFNEALAKEILGPISFFLDRVTDEFPYNPINQGTLAPIIDELKRWIVGGAIDTQKLNRQDVLEIYAKLRNISLQPGSDAMAAFMATQFIAGLLPIIDQTESNPSDSRSYVARYDCINAAINYLSKL